ncbi:MAG TPA: class I SAM-dependent methyltransferase [Candidatus Acidoferrum sp.]|nr:class I SAM-dependent methyltransferase [Candidatus Acidoferrum sp.]
MRLDGHVDRFTMFSIHGWAADREHPGRTVGVEIVRNDRLVAVVPARGVRADLLNAGVVDARGAFWFNPFESLEYGENRFEVRFADTRALLPNGTSTLYYDTHSAARFAAEDPMTRSKERWQGAESEASLTWGSVMTGDTFIGALGAHVDLGTLRQGRILEVGPGYGRLLASLRAAGHTYRSYTGLDLSGDRVQKLSERFGDEHTRFVRGDAMTDQVEAECDLFVCSATFEHLYPSFVRTLQNVQRQLALGAWACVDFVQLDPEMLVSEAWFEAKDRGGAFVRVYARAELERLFTACGFEVAGVASVSPGRGPGGESIERILVCARNRGIPETIEVPLVSPAIELFALPVDERDDAGTLKKALRAHARRQAFRLWRLLQRLRNTGPIKPAVDRVRHLPAYQALKRHVSTRLLGHR